jgi:hypothetical protein
METPSRTGRCTAAAVDRIRGMKPGRRLARATKPHLFRSARLLRRSRPNRLGSGRELIDSVRRTGAHVQAHSTAPAPPHLSEPEPSVCDVPAGTRATGTPSSHPVCLPPDRRSRLDAEAGPAAAGPARLVCHTPGLPVAVCGHSRGIRPSRQPGPESRFRARKLESSGGRAASRGTGPGNLDDPPSAHGRPGVRSAATPVAEQPCEAKNDRSNGHPDRQSAGRGARGRLTLPQQSAESARTRRGRLPIAGLASATAARRMIRRSPNRVTPRFLPGYRPLPSEDCRFAPLSSCTSTGCVYTSRERKYRCDYRIWPGRHRLAAR